jgi:hypothetical protein
MIRTRAFGILGVMAMVANLGCEGGNGEKQPVPPKPAAKPVAAPATKQALSTSVPSRLLPFLVVPLGKEKRSGFYAFWFPAGTKWEYKKEFSAAADGKPADRQRALIAGRRITLIGKLPGTVGEHDFFQGQVGTIKGTEIEVTAKYVRYAGKTSEPPARRAAYLVVYLPALPAGKYRARVVIADHIYKGDRAKITRVPPTRPPTLLRPLICRFEVRAAGKVSWGKPGGGPRAGLSAAEAKFESGKPMEFVVHLKNIGKKPLKLANAGAMSWLGYSLEWHLVFTPKGGGIPRRAVCLAPRWKYNPPNISLAAGQSALVRVLVGGKKWQFVDARPLLAKKDLAGPLTALPPGKYTVTASYEHAAGHAGDEACQYWHGKVTTGAVEIEIKPKAKVKK